jgi:endonuclease-3
MIAQRSSDGIDNRSARAKRVRRYLARTYPDATCALDLSSPLELLVATILSAQCTDARVNMVTPGLFKKYPAASDYAAGATPNAEKKQ